MIKTEDVAQFLVKKYGLDPNDKDFPKLVDEILKTCYEQDHCYIGCIDEKILLYKMKRSPNL